MNTINAKLVGLSQQMYKRWFRETVLVQSCDTSLSSEFSLKTREVDIPVYYDISVHQTTIKERELSPSKPELISSSVKRVKVDKGRYSHWGTTKINDLIDDLSKEESQMRKNLVTRWALEAEDELAVWCAKLPDSQKIDMTSILTGKKLDSDTLFAMTDTLKAFVKANEMNPNQFTLFVSEKYETIIRESKLVLSDNLDANKEFATGLVGMANGVTVREIGVDKLVTRDTTSKQVLAEWGIWKAKDGIQYIVPYKNTISYEISPEKILLGGTGYQMLEYYDFFNLYPARLFKVRISYDGTTFPPTL